MRMNSQQRIRTNLTLKKTNEEKKKMKDYYKDKAKRMKEWTAWFR